MKACVCPDCGVKYRVPGDDCTARCFCRSRNHRDPMQCRHIGEPYDDTITVKNCGCASAESQLRVFACALHGECLPTYRRGDLPEPVKTCKGCGDYEAK